MAKTDHSEKKAKLLAVINSSPEGADMLQLYAATGTGSGRFGREYGAAMDSLRREGLIRGVNRYGRGMVWSRPFKKKHGPPRADFNRHKVYMGREVK